MCLFNLLYPASRVIYVHAERQYEGRKPQATITIAWDGDRYFFKLIVDGEERMQSEEREELKAEAQRLGAELEETHTP